MSENPSSALQSSAHRISLCIITGNESVHIVRLLDSFKDAFDELCLVRATGNLEHDDTVSLAKKWCDQNRKAFIFEDYFNAGREPRRGADVDLGDPATWPHVDDFAAARNRAWSLATSPYQFWADCDDVLATGSAERIRSIVEKYDHDVFCFAYELPGQAQSNLRERLFRRGAGSWCQPLHENCNHKPGAKIANDSQVVFIHSPLANAAKDLKRNERILLYHTRHRQAFTWELHREYYYRWRNIADATARDDSLYLAEICLADRRLAPEMRYTTLCNCAEIHPDAREGKEYAREAAEMFPNRREADYVRALRELEDGNPGRAVAYLERASVFRRPAATGYPLNQEPYGFPAFDLLLRCLRLSGSPSRADKLENQGFEKHGRRFSLLHATRGRPQQAIDTRKAFLSAAARPEQIEHIFAIDADDTASIEALKGYKHIIVQEPRGCVKAWNAAAAASKGDVLMQLSDDWLPCLHWDHFVWEALDKSVVDNAWTKEGVLRDIKATPLVLAIDDGTRRDALLCMAILTRARYDQQGFLFHPDYFGVFSDNEFTHRAYDDGVVVDGRHILFRHNHPIFTGIPPDKWDETHKRQNAPERYREGMEVFNRRNPKHQIC